ncbi:hypothetical protein QR721_10705 [Aciduricibacillus chroicocephali]|uniref:GGDEF domain-containing protein n=1 Tax=Aciduricibacillus chroicocephali TaxID=3054939 RepID=A0ABY9KTF8_9BACI|nr:hypothetical protein QR721_10705 [Bacillaceae bacterium 44XB]
MKNQYVFGLLMLLVLLNGWLILIADLPFSKIDFILAAMSLVIMTALPGRFIFLYLAIVVLGYGGFLTGYSFWFHETGTIQTQYIYNHLLVTSFLLLYWVLIYQIKALTTENDTLALRIAKLEKIDKDTQILTPDEFLYQARFILSSTRRHSEAWLVEMDIEEISEYAQENLQEYLEAIVLDSVREQFDIVTATPGKIFFILKETHENGVEIVLDRIRQKQKEALNLVNSPYTVHWGRFTDENQLENIEGVIA